MLHFDQTKGRADARRVPHGCNRCLSDEVAARGLISIADAQAAQRMAVQQGVHVADVLGRDYRISDYTIAAILADAAQSQLINPLEQPPDENLIAAYGPANCLKDGLLPWRRMGGACIVLTARPDHFTRHRTRLSDCFGHVRMAVTTEEQLHRAVQKHCDRDLVKRAESKVADHESCRHWDAGFALWIALCVALVGIASLILAPTTVFAIFTAWAILTLCLNAMLKGAAAYLGWREAPQEAALVTPARLPVITVLVPLYNETAIAEHLLTRLKALDYPRALLDICLVLEADDQTTRDTLGRTTLPTWMRAIVVPKGTIKTKPRALNYALDFARGSIIGIWDAEDGPAPDQLHVVAHSFANAAPDVACLQGTLDYYNAGSNWLTRCFTIEYASWFRVILPGLAKLGLVVPLGGTTLFFRREILEELGGWDAHNVTEDADLGVRLARHGYRTALIDTVTEEEANGRAWPWVKQRSRWLKGYAITYGVHIRSPSKLWRDLGAWRFFGFQVLFLGTLSQFVLAPILWSFWLIPLGLDHPLRPVLAPWAFWTLAGLFLMSEVIGFVAATIGLRKARKPWLIKWALTLQAYFPLGALAAYKGLWELARKPFYWDKTAHGVLLPKGWKAGAIQPPPPPLHPVSGE
ncbi:glycosyltransferase [Cognatiyoonia sp. IB215446]|uniref:glycosyltransferase family 2 protein n=1 Tax=Cognatiyoonia sp. IB215446 TaxID=3097355 RepID=UPI002A128F50|nr:glycosyltransferase family 2 protein [Cognatiyoonia sp. IB215446]MDX8348421.1 glycosyltransferase [Cognatiyoonia sp. IB215446]